jgi:hypothetical protein
MSRHGTLRLIGTTACSKASLLMNHTSLFGMEDVLIMVIYKKKFFPPVLLLRLVTQNAIKRTGVQPFFFVMIMVNVGYLQMDALKMDQILIFKNTIRKNLNTFGLVYAQINMIDNS